MSPRLAMLARRLERVEALHAGATTEGERRAAAEARARLRAKLDALHAADPVAAFVREHLAGCAIPRAPEPPHRPLPTQRELLSVLTAWEAGEITSAAVQRWASEIVDAVELPTEAHGLGACRGEVLLQLTMLDRVRLNPRDVVAIRRFLRTRDWVEWFALVADASRRGHRVRG